MDKKEIWLPVKGYEGLYEVSSLGRVRSIVNDKSRKTKVLSPGDNGIGYLQVGLFKNGKRKHFKVHRLVAQAFLPNWFEEPEVNHRDENKHNNHIDNLEWCEHKYNCNHGTRNERIITNGKLSKPVLQYTKSGEFVKEWNSTNETIRSGYKQANVCACCNGKLKSYKGYIWKYKNSEKQSA